MFPTIKLRKRKSGLYSVRVYDGQRHPKEKLISTHTRNLREAETALNRVAHQIISGNFDPWKPKMVDASTGPLTFWHAAVAFLQSREGRRKATQDAYMNVLRVVNHRLPAGMRLDAVVLSQLTPYLIDKHVAPATRAHRLAHLRAFFGWCVQKKLCPVSPLDGFTLSDRGETAPTFFEPEEIDRLVAAMACAGDGWLRDAVVLAICTGMRRGELCALRWEGVDLTPERETLTLRNGAYGFHTKNGRDVRKALMGDAVDVLHALADARPEGALGSDPVLRGVHGGPVYPSFLSHRFKAYVRKLGLNDALHFHSLRHSTGTWMMRAGAPEAVVAQMLGHSSTQVTRRYVHALHPDVRAFGSRAFPRRKE